MFNDDTYTTPNYMTVTDEVTGESNTVLFQPRRRSSQRNEPAGYKTEFVQFSLPQSNSSTSVSSSYTPPIQQNTQNRRPTGSSFTFFIPLQPQATIGANTMASMGYSPFHLRDRNPALGTAGAMFAGTLLNANTYRPGLM